MAELASTLELSFGFTQSEAIGATYTNIINGTVRKSQILTDGNGEGQANQVFPFDTIIPPSSDLTLDLTSLSVELSLGASGIIDMNQVRGIFVYNRNTNSGEYLHLGGGGDAWLGSYDQSSLTGVSPVEVVGPGDVVIKTNVLEGFNIADSNIRLSNPNDVDLDVQVVILGSDR